MFLWPDYLVFAIMLASSAAIGFYHACTGGKQKTTREYLLANRNMHWFPVAASLFSSAVSSQTMIGVPGEVYSFGTIVLYQALGVPIAIVLATRVFLPVFWGLGITSVFEYLEMRFSKLLRYTGLVLFCLSAMVYAALVIYGPSLALSAATGLNIWLCIFSLALIAILYTVLGGMKAVLWTDTVQALLMVGGLIGVIVAGVVSEGGLSNVWEANRLSGRLDFLDSEAVFAMDPRIRHTFWNQMSVSVFLWLGAYGTYQASIQRVMVLRSRKFVGVAYGATAAAVMLFVLACGFVGMLIFSHYKYCDPLTAGEPNRKRDQLYPLIIMDLFGHLPGVPGLIFSAVFSASLSTISTLLCSLATVILQDVVLVLKPNLTDRTATLISKAIALVLGALCVALTLIAKYFGKGIYSLGLLISGMLNGPIKAVFTLGILVPMANSRGTTIGFLLGTGLVSVMGIGGLLSPPYIHHYPVTTEGCNATAANMSLIGSNIFPVYNASSYNPASHFRSGASALFDVSYAWNGSIGFWTTFLSAIMFSAILDKSHGSPVNRHLLSPVLFSSCCKLPQSWIQRIDFKAAKPEKNTLILGEEPEPKGEDGVELK